jgi:hypothetical protein
MLSLVVFLVLAGSVNVLFMVPLLSVFFPPIYMTKVKWQPSLTQDSKQHFIAHLIFRDY